jgi:DNA-binding NtrC family response regulator
MNSSFGNRQEALNILQHELFQFSPPIESSQPNEVPKIQKMLEEESTQLPPADLRSTLKRQTIVNEKEIIEEALKKSRFQKNKAAEMLGISRTTLWRKLKEFGID